MAGTRLGKRPYLAHPFFFWLPPFFDVWFQPFQIELPYTCDGEKKKKVKRSLEPRAHEGGGWERTKVTACWASWTADLPMIQARHPDGATLGRGIMVTKHGSGQSGSDTVGGDGKFCSAPVVDLAGGTGARRP